MVNKLLCLLCALFLIALPYTATRGKRGHVTLLYQGFAKHHLFKSVLPVVLLLEQVDGPPANEGMALRCDPTNTVRQVGVDEHGARIQVNAIVLVCDGDRTYNVKEIVIE